MIPTEKDQARFWSKVNKTEYCWEWTSQILKSGYGTFWCNKKNIRAHRFSYLIHDRDPKELSVLHRCDNRKCVNPEHLFLGTHTDNMTDAVNRGRIAKGPKVASVKLITEAVISIRERYAKGGISHPRLAREYGVSLNTIWKILSHRTWKHI